MSELTTKTVAEEALELAQWLGTGQALLARLEESFGNLWLIKDALRREDDTESNIEHYEVGKIIRAAVEHFGRMPDHA